MNLDELLHKLNNIKNQSTTLDNSENKNNANELFVWLKFATVFLVISYLVIFVIFNSNIF